MCPREPSTRFSLRVRAEARDDQPAKGTRSTDPCVVARNESGPRYVSHYHVRALRQESFCVLEGIGDGLRDCCGEFDALLSFVVGDLQVECREYLTLDRGFGVPQRRAQIWDITISESLPWPWPFDDCERA